MKNKIKPSSIQNPNNRITTIVIILIFIFGGYAFFFNSGKIIGVNYDYTPAEIGSTEQFEHGKEITLTRADYDKNKGLIEFEFAIDDDTYGEAAEYLVTMKSASKKGRITQLQTEVVNDDFDVYVIRAEIPKNFKAVLAQITLQETDKTTTVKFYEDVETLYSVNINENATSRIDFIRIGTERNIENFNSQIKELQNNNAELQNKINNIDDNINKSKVKLAYLTGDELQAEQTKISSMLNDRNAALTETDNNNRKIEEYKNNILELQKKLEASE